jgi:hypothetical protein
MKIGSVRISQRQLGRLLDTPCQVSSGRFAGLRPPLTPGKGQQADSWLRARCLLACSREEQAGLIGRQPCPSRTPSLSGGVRAL